MKPELIIPIFTGLVSVLASVVVTTLSNRSELKRIRRELEQSYEKSLFDKRVEVYPKLYKQLSSIGKLVEYGEATRSTLLEFREKVDEWNSSYSLFFTPATTKISWRFRNYIFLLLKEDCVTEEHWGRIRSTARLFEAALRAEIGIFNVPAVGPVPNLQDTCEQLDQAATGLRAEIRAHQLEGGYERVEAVE
jgi:hypothetical protein